MTGPRPLPAGGSWRRWEHHTSVGSTNDLALASLASGEPPGVVVTADHQTSGRGRRGRDWEDRPGADVAASMTVAHPDRDLGMVPIAVGVALAEVLEGMGVDAGLKWPNDVVLRTAGEVAGKLAGILVEVGDGGLVVGVGVNVDHRGRPPVDGAADVATATGGSVERWDLLLGLLTSLEHRLADVSQGRAEVVAEAHAARSTTLGRDVVAHLGSAGEVRGRAVRIAPGGGLVVHTGDGAERTVTSGEVVHLR